MKILIVLKRLITAFFVNIVFKPLRLILRFVFYNIVVKVYSLYLSWAKKAGLYNYRNKINISSPFSSQKTIHTILIILAAGVVGMNLFVKSHNQSASDIVQGTIISDLVSDEFEGLVSQDELIEDLSKPETPSTAKNKYSGEQDNLKSEVAIGQESEEDETDNTVLLLS